MPLWTRTTPKTLVNVSSVCENVTTVEASKSNQAPWRNPEKRQVGCKMIPTGAYSKMESNHGHLSHLASPVSLSCWFLHPPWIVLPSAFMPYIFPAFLSSLLKCKHDTQSLSHHIGPWSKWHLLRTSAPDNVMISLSEHLKFLFCSCSYSLVFFYQLLADIYPFYPPTYFRNHYLSDSKRLSALITRKGARVPFPPWLSPGR